ncbi:MAG: sulfatase, partial [Opitutales bacterium]
MDFELSPSEWRERLTRRSFLSAGVQGIGAVALGSLLARDLKAAPNPIGALPGLPHFAPKAKRMICLW